MADVFNLEAVLSLDSSAFENGIAAVKSGVSTSMKVIGAAVATGTAAVGAFAKASITTGEEFDSSMSQVAATMGLTMDDIENNVDGAGDTFTALRDKAKEMGSETNFSATEAAEGLNILAMSGYDATQSMDMIEDVLHLAAAGSMDMASAADYVAGSMKGFNDSTKDSAYYADLMAKGATLANTSVAELGEAMSGGSASAAAYNQTAESMTVSLLRLAEQGEAGSAASTALAAAMKNIYTPTDQAAEALAALGVEAYDETGAARDFNTVVNELAGALDGMSDSEANAYKDTIFGIQGLDAFNKMTVTSIEKQEQWADALAGATGEAAQQYDTMTDNLEGDIDIFNSALDGLKIAVSDDLSGTAREFVQFGSNALSQLTAGFEEGGIDGAVDALSDIITQAVDMITEKLPEFLEIGTKLITALVTAVVDNAPQIIQAIVDILPTLIDTLAGVIPDVVDGLLESADIILDAISENLLDGIDEDMPDIIDGIMDITNKILEHLPELLSVGVQLLYALLEGLVNSLPTIIEWLPTLVQTICDGLVEQLPVLLQSAISLFMALVQAIPQVIPALIDALPDIISSVTMALIESIPTLVQAGFDLFVALIQALPEIITSIVEAVPQIIDKTKEKFQEMWPKMKDAGKELLTNVGTGIENSFQAIGDTITKLKDKFKEWFDKIKTDALTWGKDLIQNFIDGILDKIDAVGETVSKVADKVKSFLGFSEPEMGPLSNFHTYAPDMMDLFAKGITDNEDVITDAISSAFNFDDYLTGKTAAATRSGGSGSTANSQQPVIVKSEIELGVNAKKLLNIVSTQNKIETRATGYNQLAMA